MDSTERGAWIGIGFVALMAIGLILALGYDVRSLKQQRDAAEARLQAMTPAASAAAR